MRPRVRPSVRPGRRTRTLFAGAAALALLGPAAGCGGSGDEGGGVPRPDHVVVVIEENRSYESIIGSSQAPYLNELARKGANLTQFFAITYPSQPNYIALFSGSTQGVKGNDCPHDFSGRSLGSELLQAGLTFTGYAEDLPRVGYRGCTSGAYVRRHNPWVNFTSLPASVNRPFTDFPTDYSELPTVSFVVPNLDNDMHDGSVRRADTWLRDNLGAYARWAMTHNSLLVVTWDEDEGGGDEDNRIPTVVAGEPVRPGDHDQPNNLYGLLRTLLDAYDLEPLGHSADAKPLDIWKD
ncbi:MULTISPECIES: alkaline phosphatase family protein [unclassified Streptomyces]|uniref:alkaline phosphatase family protein n=1 Tax=unclassified Streptomyces TaxID=2593676 RepID=UPI0024B66551|nr:alkaline phosphatase family protein [Streptomyces sp. KAU_LT]MDI9829955.1 alkaline phosphatase family protein [Streptomyces sp. KAU_LT]